MQKYNAAAFGLHVMVLIFEIVVIATMYCNDFEVSSYLNSQSYQCSCYCLLISLYPVVATISQ